MYIENVDEGVLTLSAFSVKMSVKRPFCEDFICHHCFCLRGLWWQSYIECTRLS